MRALSNEKKLVLVVVATLLLQTLGRYYSKPFLIWTSFDLLKFVLIFILPVIIARLFIFTSLSEMGLGRPRLYAKYWVWLALGVILIPLVIALIQHQESYLQYYSSYRQDQIPIEDRLQRFLLFALSTITGWELIHRGFLLPALRKLLTDLKFQEKVATLIAVLWVMSLEVTYHFLKPDLETWGMLVYSPLASLLAIKARSIWPGLFLHLWIELFFILNVTGLI